LIEVDNLNLCLLTISKPQDISDTVRADIPFDWKVPVFRCS